MNLGLLKQKNFFLLMQGKLVSYLGTHIQTFALSLYVLNVYKSSTLFASILILGQIPRLILGPFAGVFVDWLDRKKIIVYSDVLSGLLVSGVAVVCFTNGGLELWHIYFLTISLALVGVLFEPAISTVIPNIMKEEELFDANSINSTIMTICNIMAPIIASILVGFLEISVILVINAVSFLLSAVTELFIQIPKTHEKPVDMNMNTFKKDFAEGINYIRTNPFIVNILTISIVFNFTINPVFAVGIPYLLKVTMGVSDLEFGLYESFILCVTLVAPFIGSMVSKKLKLGQIIFLSVGLQPFVTVALYLSSLSVFAYYVGSVTMSYILMVAIGSIAIVVITLGNISVGTYFQKNIPKNLMGRAMTVISTVGMAAMPLGQGLFGVALDYVPNWIPFAVAALLLLLTAMRTYRLFVAKGESETVSQTA